MQSNDKDKLFSGMLPGDVNRLEIINIKKFMMSRSLEIDDMFNTLKRYDKQERIFQKLPFVMRRRAMSHNPFRVPKSIRFHIVSEMSKNTPKALKRIRKDKKRRLNRLEDYQKRSSRNTWLETHLYHAKRFKMANLWGYKLAVTATQKSKRRYLRFVKRNCLIHDRSYMGILSVTGELNVLRESFKNIFTDSYLLFNESFLSGNLKGACVFSYHGGAERYRLACPVNFIWKRAKDDTHTVWFIVHPSARDELYNILIKFKEITTTMIDNMAIFELLGPLSGLYLKAVLKLDGNSSTGNEIWKSLNPENITLPSHFILPLLIKSPEVIGSFSPEYKISMMKNHYHNMKYDYTYVDLSEERLKLHEFKRTDKSLARFVIPRRRKKNYTKLLEKLLRTINIQNSDGSNRDIKLKSTRIETEITEPVDDNLIPVWLINRNLPIVGFDLILPANTIANKLWILLNRYGALGLGIEDREFILNRFNQTTFPQDYPDTYSGASHYSDIKRCEVSKYLICPSSKRVNYSLIGMDNPFAIPYFGKERKLNLKLPVDLVPECHKGHFDGNLLNSRHLLLSSITSGLYNAMENEDFTVLRLTSNPLGSMNVYFTALLTQLQSDEFQNLISKVPTNQFISSRITPLRKGTVDFLSRIYLPKTEDHKLFPPDLLADPGASKTKLYVPNLQEPIHEEYKLSNIKLLLYGDNKKHKLDVNSAISQLENLSNRGINTYRQCIGFVTSRGIMKTGGCFIQLRGFLQIIKDSMDTEKIPSCDKLRLNVWVRNRISPEYFPGIVSIQFHDALNSMS